MHHMCVIRSVEWLPPEAAAADYIMMYIAVG